MQHVIRRISWPYELITLTIIFGITNLMVITIGYRNVYSLGYCQLINLCGIFLMFYLWKIHINQLDIELKEYFNPKKLFKWSNLLIIPGMIIAGRYTVDVVEKFDLIRFFNYESLRGHVIGHFTLEEKKFSSTVLVIVVTLSVMAEELFIRGYLFEKQFKRFDKHTWIVNGISASVIHLFSASNWLVILPCCWIFSLVYQWKRNIWITLIAHLIWNYLILYGRLKLYF
ncbi:CPBP family intramembrane metalloprotease [Puteibacter caeruleilacunae]|nr:CPBP family intramembrane metalloprotease [Puteibacter caeruleilacunae]